jgi:serine/threonine protein kinase
MNSAGQDALHKFREASDFFMERWKSDDISSWDGVKMDVAGNATTLRVVGTYANRCRMPELPAEITLLHTLTTLSLCWMKRLAKLPPEIGTLAQLTSLDLSGCQGLTELPKEIGGLRALMHLALSQCRSLETLPSSIGTLAKLESLVLSDCMGLRKLPADAGQLVELSVFKLNGCESLVFPPERLHTAPADEVTAFLAAHLVIKEEEISYERMYDEPNERDKRAPVGEWLFGRPKAIAAFFELVLLNESLSALQLKQLGRAVEDEPALTELRNAKGERALDVACKACKKTMHEALFLLARFEVDLGTPLHLSSMSCILAATDCADMSLSPLPRRALKAVRSEAAMLAELKGRESATGGGKIEARYVPQIIAVYVDSAVCKDPAVLPYDGKVPIETCEALANKLAALLRSRRRTGRAPMDEGSRRLSLSPSKGASTAALIDRDLDTPCMDFRYLIVMRLADRSLASALVHDRLAGHDFFLCRRILADVAKALEQLHKIGMIHADVKPLHVVRSGGSWQLIDLVVAMRNGKRLLANRAPSSSPCPPEMARAFINAVDPLTGEVSLATLKKQHDPASIAYDLWSYGTLVYHLVFGRPIWRVDHDGELLEEDPHRLANWKRDDLEQLLLSAVVYPTNEQLAASGLLRMLLEPNPLLRLAHFGDYTGAEMRGVMRHPFFFANDLDSAEHERAQAWRAGMQRDVALARRLSGEHVRELRRTRELFSKHSFETCLAGAFKTRPTAFVLCSRRLLGQDELSKMCNLTLVQLSCVGPHGNAGEAALSDDEAQFAAQVFSLVNEALEWVRLLNSMRLQELAGAPDPSGVDVAAVFQTAKEVIREASEAGSDFFRQPMMLYWVDELTCNPVGEPLEIQTELVPTLLPLMQVSLRAALLHYGVAGMARMLGAPVKEVPTEWWEHSTEAVDALRHDSNLLVELGSAPTGEDATDGFTVMGTSLRALGTLEDRAHARSGVATSGGLRRFGNELGGTYLWTAVNPAQVFDAVEELVADRRVQRKRGARDSLTTWARVRTALHRESVAIGKLQTVQEEKDQTQKKLAAAEKRAKGATSAKLSAEAEVARLRQMLEAGGQEVRPSVGFVPPPPPPAEGAPDISDASSAMVAELEASVRAKELHISDLEAAAKKASAELTTKDHRLEQLEALVHEQTSAVSAKGPALQVPLAEVVEEKHPSGQVSHRKKKPAGVGMFKKKEKAENMNKEEAHAQPSQRGNKPPTEMQRRKSVKDRLAMFEK